MAFTLERVIPWGRSFAEYERMFALTEADFQRRILGCADGPAGFNADATRRGVQVVSVDPLYAFSAAEIRSEIKKVVPQVLEQTRRNRADFVWREFASIEALGWVRLRAMARFLRDYPAGAEQGRYVTAELPTLPFEDGEFELALCSHFLFLYSDHLSEQLHIESVIELCRVAEEVRIFPIVTLAGQLSPFVAVVQQELEHRGLRSQAEMVRYEFQRGGNQMLRISR